MAVQSSAVCCYQNSEWAFIRYWVCIWSMCNSKYGQMCCDANTDYNGRSQVDPCYERSHPINLIAWLWSASIHQLINEIFCLLKILFKQLQMSLVCDINAMSRLVPSLFLSLTLSRCPPTQWIKCPLAYLSPVTNIHLNIASNSIQCIQHLRRMSTPRYLLGLWPSEPFAGNWRSVNMWSGASHGHIVLISIFTSIPRQ